MSYKSIDRLIGEDPCRVRVELRTGAPRLIINDEEVAPFAAWSWGLKSSASLFADAGINILHPIIGLNIAWIEDGEYDFAAYDELFNDLLEDHPGAFFLPRILFDMPDWWLDANEDELIQCALPKESDNLQYGTYRLSPEGGMRWNNPLRAPSLASKKYLADVSRLYEAFLRHIEASPLKSRIIGYQVGAGIYGEWHHSMAEFMPDESLAAEALIGPLPDVHERIGYGSGLLRNPETENNVIDYYHRFHNDLIAPALLSFARTTKQATGQRVLCGCFYGYLLENVWIQEGGHLAAKKVLESPDIDFLAGPFTYQTTNIEGEPWWNHDVVDGANNHLGRARGVAGDGGYRVLLESLRRRGKLFFVEADSGTCLVPPPGDLGGAEAEIDNLLTNIGGEGSESLRGTLQVLSRDLGRMWAGGSGGWLFDFGPAMSLQKSWYDHPEIRTLLKKFSKLMDERDVLDLSPVAEVAAIYNPESFFSTRHWRAEKPLSETGSMDYFSHWFLDSQARALHRTGMPVDFLYSFDLTREDLERYKLIFVVNDFRMTAEDVTRYRSLLRGTNTRVVWMYAPGYIGEDRFDLDQMTTLTGFTFAELDEPGTMLIELDDPQVVGAFGVNQEERPRFHVLNGERVLGRWSGSQEVGCAERTDPDGWTSIYVGTAPLPVHVLGQLASDANIRKWSSRDDIVVASADAAMIVATSDGERTVSFPKEMKPVFHGGNPSTQHKLSLEIGDVRLFKST